MEERVDDDRETLELISAAVMAGAYYTLARQFPGHAGDLVKKGVQLSAQVKSLADAMFNGGGAWETAPPPRRAL